MIRAELLSVLERLNPAIATDDRIPILQCICFDGKYALAYDSVLGIIAPCKSDDGFAVSGKTLIGLLSNSHSQDVEMAPADKHDILIKAGKSRFHLPFHPADEYIFKEPEGEWELTFRFDEPMMAGMDACLQTVSSDLTQPKLNGVALVANGKTMAFYGCSSNSLTRFATKIKKHDLSVLIPTKFCEAVLRLMRDTECQDCTISIGPSWAKAELDNGYRVYGNLCVIDGGLIDYEGLITKTLKGTTAYVQVPEELNGALSRARIVADAENAKTSLILTKGKLALHTETSRIGVVDDTVPWPDKSEIEADVLAQYVQRAIGICDTMTITDRCTAYKKGDVFVLVSNMQD